MGVSQAGIVFKINQTVCDVQSLVSKICNGFARRIEHPNHGDFDIRNDGDVMVQIFGDSCFICSDALAWCYLEDQERSVEILWSQLGCPELMMVFCRYDSGGSCGYAFVEHGQRTRTLLEVIGEEYDRVVTESGAPKAIEMRWNSASFIDDESDAPPEEWVKFYHLEGDKNLSVSEFDLHYQMLDEMIEAEFGVCPWCTDIEPIYNFFKIDRD